MMRDEKEVQRAHDMLVAVIKGEVDAVMDDVTRKILHGAADALCWVLCHEQNPAFSENLVQLEKTLGRWVERPN